MSAQHVSVLSESLFVCQFVRSSSFMRCFSLNLLLLSLFSIRSLELLMMHFRVCSCLFLSRRLFSMSRLISNCSYGVACSYGGANERVPACFCRLVYCIHAFNHSFIPSFSLSFIHPVHSFIVVETIVMRLLQLTFRHDAD